ncbi:histidine kinase [Streptomyces gilvosporeus]|uniref:histidine kinase n=2 Tax=Streptomyces gilvosporeus TaxID=553510 RepID=A0A1V0TX80_9ACTN|nr:histidine kinase [Streptomyces gilvosporeus]
MKRLRGGAGKPGSPANSVSGPGSGTTGGTAGAGGRPARVRNRLVGAVAVVAAAVLGAGAPALATAADNAQTSQQLVDLAELNARAITLAHSLADERDAMTAYVATGRGGRAAARHTGVPRGTVNAAPDDAAPASAKSPDSAAQRDRVDQQIRDLRQEANDASGDTAVFAAADKLLRGLDQTRRQALTGPGTPEETHAAYTEVIQALGAIGDDIARGLPARADTADADTRALPFLGRAADQAAGTRGLLLAALQAGGPQPRLTTAAQVAHLREQGALDDFQQSASQGARDRYDRTVTGGDVTTAERYLTRLTDQPRLDAADLRLNRGRVAATLTSRISLMRGVESAMATADTARLAALRDDDVTALEIRIGLEGLCLLLAVGAGIWAARSMTQPLAALRLGAKRIAADPGNEEPIGYKGRNDEFAAAVRSVNALHAQVSELARRNEEWTGERTRLIGSRQRLAAEREVLQDQAKELKAEIAELHERLAVLRSGVHGRFVSLSLRTLSLVERQLGVIESLEEGEQDPDRLGTLFKLDHFAARMRRNSENLLVLAGAEQHGNTHPGPVPLLDVLRAAISEIERYERVRIQSLPPHSQVAGFAADDLSHLVAELLENATAFSPPDAHVELSGWLLESGEVMLSVRDEGIGMTADKLRELNERLTDAEAASSSETVDEALGLGLYVVVRLAARHGVRVSLRDQKQGGITAVVVLPKSILPTRPAPAGAAPSTVPQDLMHTPSLPGSVAEANSNALPTRVARSEPAARTARDGAAEAEPEPDGAPGAVDPLVAAAERAVEAAEAEPAAEAADAAADETPAAKTADAAEHTRPADASHPRPQEPAAAPAAAEDPYAIGPDAHTGPAEEPAPEASDEPTAAAATEPATARATEEAAQNTTDDTTHDTTDTPEPLRTALGLPKRTPKVVAQQQASAAPRKSGAAGAEALRRRLGGFQQGARDGRREVEAELAEGSAEQHLPHHDTDGAGAPGHSHVIEEARE